MGNNQSGSYQQYPQQQYLQQQYPQQYPQQFQQGGFNQMRAGTIVGKWQAQSVNGIRVNFPVQITQNNISFRYCNQKNFPYSSQGNQINVQAGASTLMACPPMNPTQEQVSSAFTSINNYEINQHTLVLKNGNNPLVVLVRS